MVVMNVEEESYMKKPYPPGHGFFVNQMIKFASKMKFYFVFCFLYLLGVVLVFCVLRF